MAEMDNLTATEFTVDVEFASHDDLKEGVTCAGWHRVIVLAVDEIDAVLIACQIVASTTLCLPTDAHLCV